MGFSFESLTQVCFYVSSTMASFPFKFVVQLLVLALVFKLKNKYIPSKLKALAKHDGSHL